jgi:hypothetical protein
MLKIRASALMLASLSPSAAIAAPESPATSPGTSPGTSPATSPAALAGIWEGSIGTLPVRACFVRREWRTFGAYYYLSRLQLIALDREEGAGDVFHEGGGDGAGAPRWRIERAGSSRLTGRWTSGSRTLAVRLRRVAGEESEEGACASLAFQRPRLAGVRTATRRASKDGVAYAYLALDTGGRFDIHIETFALDGDSEAVRRLNATLGETLAGNPPQWFGCVSGSLAQGPNEGSENQHLEPAMISRRWLSVTAQYDGFCGGAHPDASSTYRTFDRTTGREIDLHDWLDAAAVHRERFEGVDEESKTLLPAFRTVILAGWHAEDAECDEVVRGQDYWNIGLTRDALVFTPLLPHVVQACGEGFTMSFERLRPYLTRDAAEHLRALQAEGPAPTA